MCCPGENTKGNRLLIGKVIEALQYLNIHNSSLLLYFKKWVMALKFAI